MLLVKKLVPEAILPKRATSGSAGYDLFCYEDVTISAGKKVLIKTGLAISLPENTYGRIAPRSGLAFKYSIDVLAGVIDSDYRGDVGVILINHSDKDVSFQKFSAIAQLILEKIEIVPVKEVKELSNTIRADGGYGSTDIKK